MSSRLTTRVKYFYVGIIHLHVSFPSDFRDKVMGRGRVMVRTKFSNRNVVPGSAKYADPETRKRQ